MRTKTTWIPLSLAMLVLPPSLRAEIKLPHLYSDHMVLQQGMMVPVWGKADAGEEVTVSLAGQRAATKADSDGNWSVRLQPLEAGGPMELTVSGKNTVKVNDIQVGEVWVASGQSNMHWWVRSAKDPEKEIAAASYPRIRMFTVGRVVAGKPMRNADGQWEVCSPETVGEFSAVGYFFARELHKSLNVPVGIINSSWGGTPAEAWTSRATLEADAELKVVVDRWDKKLADYPKQLDEYKKAITAWIDDSAAREKNGRPVKPVPTLPADPRSEYFRPSGTFNAMIAPLVPYGIRGAIWYQGEANASRAYQYRKLFSSMIQDWRRAWGQGDFPFLFVQLANFKLQVRRDGTWAELREAQTTALNLKNTGMAVAIDIGEPDDIHPKDKQAVGRRLALAAQAIAYGRKVAYSGPSYESMSIEDNKVRLTFKFAEGLKTSDGQTPRGFVISGEDGQFSDAEARIDGNSVVVWSDVVPRPVAVRYGWNDNPTCSLYNGADLPASPFRTDNWPGLTVDEK